MKNISFGGATTEPPSIHTTEEDYFEGVTSPNSPHRTINDMISVSTAAAGPSVQLVERMSAAVRRLESEKASTKEELARLSAQRDEAREEVVRLIREVEGARGTDEKCKQTQSELNELNARYQTTLEMLGEKSEMVDELQADIFDVKKIYRELLDRTMK
jgi:predicted RNase H-like nuclease (RuvC/YqgF family)